MILDDILESKRQELEAAKREVSFEEMEARLRNHLTLRNFKKSLQLATKKPALIAELKRKSPSRGMLRERFDPVSLAQQLQDAGASALSVLTDERYFGGHLDFLRDAHDFTEVPLLRKDFILEAYQIYEAAHAQADAVLLIAGLLDDRQLKQLRLLAEGFGMDALVEIHQDDDAIRAVDSGASMIGVNARDLRDFSMHPEAIERLVPKIPKGAVVVAESGVQSAADVKRLAELGVQAVLIGEALMTAPDVKVKVRELFQGQW